MSIWLLRVVVAGQGKGSEAQKIRYTDPNHEAKYGIDSVSLKIGLKWDSW